jgi:hypothetical protein
MDFNIEVDLNDVKQFIDSPDFAQYLLSHTTDFATAAWILQTLLDAVDAAASS